MQARLRTDAGFLVWTFAALVCASFAAQARGSQPVRPRARLRAQAAPSTGPSCTPTGSCRLRYYGGKVIPNVKVYQVNWTAGGQRDMSAFFAAITGSSYLDWLNEYSTNIAVQAGTHAGAQGTNQIVGRGVFGGSFTVTPSAANAGGTQQCGGTVTANCCFSDVLLHGLPAGAVCVQDGQIEDELQKQIAAGQLPASDDSSLYFVFFPANIVVGLQGHSACVGGGFCGYHSTYRPAASSPSVYYAVIPSHEDGSGCDLGCGDPLLSSAFDRLCETSSHELAESITDPEVGIGAFVDFPLGWYDVDNAEIADICDSSPHATSSGFVVEPLFSNRQASATSLASACVAQRFEPTDFTVSILQNGATVVAGGAAQVPISTAIASGGAQTLNLSVANLPVGVTAILDPPTVGAGSPSTLTLSAAAGASARRDAVVQVKAENGSVTHSAGLLLQVDALPAAHDFSIAVSPSAQAVVAGSSVPYGLTTAITNGSAETIHLTVAGLPSGVTASFSSTRAASADLVAGTADTLSLTAAAGTPASAPTTFTVLGTTPSVPAGHSATATLAVTPASDFSLNLPVADVFVPRGSTNTVAVLTAAVSGSPAQVDLSAIGLPAGVSASFLPARVAPGIGSALTLTASPSAHLASRVAFTVVATSPDAVHTQGATLSVTGTPGIPTVAINRPGEGPVSGPVEIEVQAAPASGADLARIEVFVDGSSVGSSTSSPARIVWPSAGVLDGTHALTARATDDDGGAATTAPISISVLNSASAAGAGRGSGGCATGGAPSMLSLLGLVLLRRSRRRRAFDQRLACGRASRLA